MKKLGTGLSLTLIILMCAMPAFAQKKGGGGGGGTPPAPFDPAVVYVQYNTKYTYDLMLMNAEGTQTKMLLAGTQTAKHGAPSFSPDGSMVVFRSAIEGPGLYVMRTDGLTPPHKLVSINREHRSAMPAWSPDGRHIVFSDGSGRPVDGMNMEDWDLFIVEVIDGQLVTGSLRNLTDTSATAEYAPSWSPDGTRLVSHVVDIDQIQEFIFNFSPGDSSTPPAIISRYSITAHLGKMAIFSSRPQWNKDADDTQRVVFSGRLSTDTLGFDIWAIDVDNYLAASGSRRIVASSDHDCYPAFSSDDSTIVYEWNRSSGKGSTLTLITNAQELLNGSQSVPVTTDTVAKASSKVVNVQEPDWRR